MSNKKDVLTEEKTENATTKQAENQEVETKEREHYVYIGPSLPGGQLKSNTVLNSSMEKIKEYYKDVLEKYPQVARLIVPIEKLGESKEKVQTSGNIINKYYNDVASEIVKNKEE